MLLFVGTAALIGTRSRDASIVRDVVRVTRDGIIATKLQAVLASDRLLKIIIEIITALPRQSRKYGFSLTCQQLKHARIARRPSKPAWYLEIDGHRELRRKAESDDASSPGFKRNRDLIPTSNRVDVTEA